MKDIICLFSIFFIITLIQPLKSQNRIVGGNDATLGSAPYTVSFQGHERNHVCGGAIISKHWMISAAHCFIDVNPEYVIAVVGTIIFNEGGDIYNISKINIHSNYSRETKENDIALLFSSKPIIFSKYVYPISFLRQYVKENEKVSFSGFGANMSDSNASTTLQTIELTIFDMETCKYAYRKIRPLFDSQICTFNGKDVGTCHGDSGAPLVANSSLIGIASFGIPCAVGYPDVFTRVSSYLPWIKMHEPNI